MSSSTRLTGNFEPDLPDGQDHGLQYDLQVLARQSRDRRRMLGMPPGLGDSSVLSGRAGDAHRTDSRFTGGAADPADGGAAV